MAKKVFMISPFEALTGNLSGNQNLQYAENNNPAYEAPNGTQYARNYRTRYVGARRGKDGLVYFQVKQTTATVLSASSRRAMAIIGVTAAIRSALMSAHAADYASMQRAFDYLKAQSLLPAGQDTFKKWFDANVKQMLVYKRATWSFNQASISFTLNNPYALSSSSALVIKTSTWVKFASNFAFRQGASGGYYFTIDGVQFFANYISATPTNVTWSDITDSSIVNPNYATSLAAITEGDNGPLYNGQAIYKGDVLQTMTADITPDKYTTADPNI